MPKIRKQSDWQPGRKRFDEDMYNDVRKLYPPDKMQEIIEFACLSKVESNLKTRKQLENHLEKKIIELGVWVKNWDFLSNRPTDGERHFALDQVAQAASNLSETIKMLDGDSMFDLRRTMINDPSFKFKVMDGGWEETFESPFYSEWQYANMQKIVDKIADWSRTAKDAPQDYKKGTDRGKIKFWLAEEIIKLWEEIGHQPSRIVKDGAEVGPLTLFADAIAKPLGLHEGYSMAHSIRVEIDRLNDMEQKGQKSVP